jgi:hypothetical protein
MTLFKRVFNTPPKSHPIAPVDMGEPELDEALDDRVLSEAIARVTSAAASPSASLVLSQPHHQASDAVSPPVSTPFSTPVTARSIDPIPRDQDYTLARAEDLQGTRRAPSAPDPSDGFAEQEAIAEQEIAAFQARIAEKQRLIDEARQSQGLHRPPQTPPQTEVLPTTPAEPPSSAPTEERSARRVRTRMLGFDQDAGQIIDPIEKAAAQSDPRSARFPVGWIIVADGPGRGHAFTLYSGVSTIGRGDNQTVTLDLGDTSISREKHAAIAYDVEANSFFLGHGGKSNIVRLNGRPVLSTEDLRHSDMIRIGETTLRFVALCGDGFTWGGAGHGQTE